MRDTRSLGRHPLLFYCKYFCADTPIGQDMLSIWADTLRWADTRLRHTSIDVQTPPGQTPPPMARLPPPLGRHLLAMGRHPLAMGIHPYADTSPLGR